jgi:RHS repeat-associated protein
MADHLGSTRLVTDPIANVIAFHDYLPFGEEILAGVGGRTGSWGASGDNINQKFTGKERDQESGLDYFGARYYGSALGRFTSPDWSATAEPVPYATLDNPQSLNLYAYLRNNPLDGVDPDGHDSLHTCTGAEQGAGKCQAGDIAVQSNANKQVGLAEKAKTAGSQALTAVGNAIGKVSDFLNTAPGIGLVAGMAIFAETGGNEETPALAEAEQGVESAVSEGTGLIANLGQKLNFLFGQSGGVNFQRSEGMRAALQETGLNDTVENRALVSENLTKALNDAGSIVSRTNNRVVRESFLMGPTGGVKLQSIWEGTKLITIKVFWGEMNENRLGVVQYSRFFVAIKGRVDEVHRAHRWRTSHRRVR